MVNKTYKVFIVLLSILLMSCATQPQLSNRVEVKWPEPDRLRFSGKGSGAGMMLMSSMGPAGIAVGIAIDEGIGKEIEEQLLADGFDFKSNFRSQLEKATSAPAEAPTVSAISVLRYGFKTFGRADFSDPIAPEIQLQFVYSDGSSKQVRYPEDFEDDVVLISLDNAKSKTSVAGSALEAALSTVLAKVSCHSCAEH